MKKNVSLSFPLNWPNLKNKQQSDSWTQSAFTRAAKTAVYLIRDVFFIPVYATAAF